MICSVPFAFEGEQRVGLANKWLDENRKTSGIKSLKLDSIGISHGHLPLVSAFKYADDQFYNIYKKEFACSIFISSPVQTFQSNTETEIQKARVEERIQKLKELSIRIKGLNGDEMNTC